MRRRARWRRRSPACVARKLAPKDDLTDADLQWLKQCDAVVQCLGD